MVRQQLLGLDADNAEAWAMFRRVFTRMVCESGAVGAVLLKSCEGLSGEDFEDMLTRLSILYDVYVPPKKESSWPAN